MSNSNTNLQTLKIDTRQLLREVQNDMRELSFPAKIDCLLYIFRLWLRGKIYQLEYKIPQRYLFYFPVLKFPNIGMVVDLQVPMIVIALAVLIFLLLG